MSSNICIKCLRPREKKTGSITQWIGICNCGAMADTAPRAAATDCRNCGKVINQARSGTITQWIFKENYCACLNPQPRLESETKTSDQATKSVQRIDEEEIHFEHGKFPSERYKPLALLGSGAMGTVYLSRDRVLGKAVAVKVLNRLEREPLLSFQNEARATSKLSHPNIVKVLDFGSTDGGVPFMVMEYISGRSLESIIKEEGAINLDASLEIFWLFECDLEPGASKIIARSPDISYLGVADIIDTEVDDLVSVSPQHLAIGVSPILTAKGFLRLSNIPNLRNLYIEDCPQISESVLASFRKAKKDCRINGE